MRNDSNTYADTSWGQLIELGQSLQKPEYDKAIAEFGNFTGTGAGSSGMPVISIICEEPEYNFLYTANLPGGFEVTCKRRWGSILRFYCSGEDQSLILYDTRGDNSGLGDEVKTGSAIGLYVEGYSQCKINGDANNLMEVKPFEQTISNIIIVPMGPSAGPRNGPRSELRGNAKNVIPIYFTHLFMVVKIEHRQSG